MSQIHHQTQSLSNSKLIIRPFSPADQQDAKDLILDGLLEHFGFINPDLNPDLNDIQSSFVENGDLFLVAEIDHLLVGTGALVKERNGVGRIVRVSVKKSFRRKGIGRKITESLITAAPSHGYTKLVVETNEDWFGAISLYQQHCGFFETDRRDGEIHMSKLLVTNM